MTMKNLKDQTCATSTAKKDNSKTKPSDMMCRKEKSVNIMMLITIANTIILSTILAFLVYLEIFQTHQPVNSYPLDTSKTTPSNSRQVVDKKNAVLYQIMPLSEQNKIFPSLVSAVEDFRSDVNSVETNKNLPEIYEKLSYLVKAVEENKFFINKSEYDGIKNNIEIYIETLEKYRKKEIDLCREELQTIEKTLVNFQSTSMESLETAKATIESMQNFEETSSEKNILLNKIDEYTLAHAACDKTNKETTPPTAVPEGMTCWANKMLTIISDKTLAIEQRLSIANDFYNTLKQYEKTINDCPEIEKKVQDLASTIQSEIIDNKISLLLADYSNKHFDRLSSALGENLIREAESSSSNLNYSLKTNISKIYPKILEHKVSLIDSDFKILKDLNFDDKIKLSNISYLQSQYIALLLETKKIQDTYGNSIDLNAVEISLTKKIDGTIQLADGIQKAIVFGQEQKSQIANNKFIEYAVSQYNSAIDEWNKANSYVSEKMTNFMSDSYPQACLLRGLRYLYSVDANSLSMIDRGKSVAHEHLISQMEAKYEGNEDLKALYANTERKAVKDFTK